MATYQEIMVRTQRAAADLRLMRHHIMRVATAPDLVNISSDRSATHINGPIGVLQNKPNSLQHASIGYFGVSKVTVGAATTANAFLTTNGSGRAINAVSGDIIVGKGLEAGGADGDVISMLIYPPITIHRT